DLPRVVDILIASTAAASSKFLETVQKTDKARAHRQLVNVYDKTIKHFSRTLNPLLLSEEGEEMFNAEVVKLNSEPTSRLLVKMREHFEYSGDEDTFNAIAMLVVKREVANIHTVISLNPIDSEQEAIFLKMLITRFEEIESSPIILEDAYKLKALASVLVNRLRAEIGLED
ncbi:hypothetical protein, partial [Oleiphilus sp. HI0128]